MPSPLLINAAELLRRPGTERRVELESTVAELGIDDPRFDAEAAVDISLRLESLTDGIVVDGQLTVPWSDSCRRCLAPASGDVVCEVHELYQQVITDPEAFEIVGDQIDVRRMVSENILLEAPIAPLCRPDCAGLCPTCGTDLNVASCGCVTTDIDPRWQALSELKVNLPEQ
ncbi:MAG TPA: YceD family protein [Ilumatobacteraceae bacterium]